MSTALIIELLNLERVVLTNAIRAAVRVLADDDEICKREVVLGDPIDEDSLLDEVRLHLNGGYPGDAVLKSELAALLQQADATLARPHWAGEALQQPTKLRWIIDGVIAEASLNVLAGPAGSLKTWVIMHLALSIALGLDWIGHTARQGTVLFVDEESGRLRFLERMRQLMQPLGAGKDTPLAFECLHGFNLHSRHGVEGLEQLISQLKPRLIVIDALVDILGGGDENAVKDVQPIFQSLRSLAETYDTAIVVIHHTNKAGGYRGSSAIIGAVDLLLRCEKETNDTVNLKSEKARDVEPFEFNVRVEFDPVADVVTVGPGGIVLNFTVPPAEQYVLGFLKARGQATIPEIKANAKGCAPSTARDAVYALEKRGKVKRVSPNGQKPVSWALV